MEYDILKEIEIKKRRFVFLFYRNPTHIIMHPKDVSNIELDPLTYASSYLVILGMRVIKSLDIKPGECLVCYDE